MFDTETLKRAGKKSTSPWAGVVLALLGVVTAYVEARNTGTKASAASTELEGKAKAGLLLLVELQETYRKEQGAQLEQTRKDNALLKEQVRWFMQQHGSGPAVVAPEAPAAVESAPPRRTVAPAGAGSRTRTRAVPTPAAAPKERVDLPRDEPRPVAAPAPQATSPSLLAAEKKWDQRQQARAKQQIEALFVEQRVDKE